MILLVSSVFPPEPVVSATIGYDLAEALSQKYEVVALTPKPSRPLGFSFCQSANGHENFKHIVLDSYVYPQSHLFGRLRESYSFGMHVVGYIKKHRDKIDCIYIHSWPLLGLVFIVKAAKRYSIPRVIHIVDIYPEALLNKLPFFKKYAYYILFPISKYALRNASKVVTISPKMRDLLATTRGLKEDSVEVVFNWQNEKRFTKFNHKLKKEHQNSVFTFMFLGNLSRTAAIHFLIWAFKESGIKNARLVIAGNGSQKDFLILLAGNLNQSNIEFIDAPMEKVPEIQNEADVLLLSLAKGAAVAALPSKLPAYMFSKKPIIACVEEDSDTANIIKQANCGWIVAPEDKVAISNAMKNAIAIPTEDLKQSGQNGYNYALENFSKTRNLSKFVSIIDSQKK